MAIGRAERRLERRSSVASIFDEDKVETALDLLELTELAWHDCYGEITPPPAVVEDILTVSGGSIEGLIEASRLAIADARDLKLLAADRRKETSS